MSMWISRQRVCSLRPILSVYFPSKISMCNRMLMPCLYHTFWSSMRAYSTIYNIVAIHAVLRWNRWNQAGRAECLQATMNGVHNDRMECKAHCHLRVEHIVFYFTRDKNRRKISFSVSKNHVNVRIVFFSY